MAEFETLTEEGLADITGRTERQRRGQLYAVAGNYDRTSQSIVIRLNNGVSASIPIALLPGLDHAAPAELETMVIEGRGYGLHIPAIDADLSIPQLFEDYLGSSAMRRAQTRANASRLNGRLGGRPRKPAKVA